MLTTQSGNKWMRVFQYLVHIVMWRIWIPLAKLAIVLDTSKNLWIFFT